MNAAGEHGAGIHPKAALAAAAVQLGLGYALLAGLTQDFVERAAPRLEVISIPAKRVTPPEPPLPPAPRQGAEAQGEAAPPAPRNKATQIVAPVPRIPIPRPLKVKTAVVAGSGNDPAAGAALAGTGTGAGGTGTGAGGSGTGTGAGEGGGGRKAARVSGALHDSDYPDAAGRVRAAGTVFIRFTVTPDGRVGGCAVTRSSGYAELDALTCHLAERRFRYRPALDSSGRPVAETVGTSFTWGPREY